MYRLISDVANILKMLKIIGRQLNSIMAVMGLFVKDEETHKLIKTACETFLKEIGEV